ncbi:hypothetical protein JNB88_22305 [Rhizobium cauense]|uniref:hypothetical protein n=1 Tax=Rhizobium cauense TaxID=1166683 RepID=UPI001C6EE34D|nr:hypothetical protein [Rhizobium cauense]MBW9116374.1 hypothetical protein [Rhizobium cauense]
MSAAEKKPPITKLYGVITLALSGVPFLICCFLAIYLAQTGNFTAVSSLTSRYDLLSVCSGRTYALISSILYIYGPLSVAALLSYLVSLPLAFLYNGPLFKFVALSSGVFSVPFLALQFPSVLVLSRMPIDVMCREHPQSLALVLHMTALFVASYVIFGNLVMLLKLSYKGTRGE